MDVYTFRAGTMHEALWLVRAKLGPQATVLRTREETGGVLRRLAGKSYVEISATPSSMPARKSAARTPVVERSLLQPNDAFGVDLGSFAPPSPADIRTSGPIRTTAGKCSLVALIGPTGVGKTTTLAKLAAHFQLKEQKRVGLITVDTFRVAAIEQLRAYADIIDLPMEVVSTPQEMRPALNRLANLDIVLLDTAGRGTRDVSKLRELNEILLAAAPDETHLVLSATAAPSQLTEDAERFAALGATAIVLTKIDEAHDLHRLFPLIRQSHLPLSYLSTGQNVPDDLEIARGARLCQLIEGISG